MHLVLGAILLVAAFIASAFEGLVYLIAPDFGPPFLVGAFAGACLVAGLWLVVH